VTGLKNERKVANQHFFDINLLNIENVQTARKILIGNFTNFLQ